MNASTHGVMRRKLLTTLLHSVLPVLVLNTVIALGLSAFVGGEFLQNMVYSHSIGLNIWLIIELAMRCWIKDRDRQWRGLFVIVPLGVTAGYAIGMSVAAWLLNHPVQWVLSPHRGQNMALLLLSLTAGGVMTYYFMSREQLSKAREESARSAAQTEAAQRHAAEAQLKLLETQLEPHMLFNTLANLRALIGVDAARAQEMLDRLVAYLRATLAASRASSYSLGAEFERLNDYLELMRVRMGARLQFELHLPAELSNQQIPPLLLQALVENSIKHGLEPSVQGGRIDIRAQRDGQRLLLQVQDTGVGLRSAAPVADPGDGGFGLRQVKERLQASYGAQASLTVANAPSGGTAVTITLPTTS
ncbi:sensor histidine kinase [Rhodoferax sp.]|uniref:sensor histidine kinase n=1 Tax=Rhodoferax sp. TaxID=50421 RepID=UPI00277AFCCB|nr:histidine kinase [Rhodoferax sp.]